MARSIAERIHLASQEIRKRIGEEHLTLTQASVLRAAREATEPPSQTDLVVATNIDRSTLADVMLRLMREKLITRRRDKSDARAYVVAITAAGLERLKAFEAAERSAERDIAATLKELGIAVRG